MIKFDTRFFQKRKFEPEIIKRYFNSALKDFRIAFKNKQPEVIFDFSYKALIKISITLIAFYGYKSKSRMGHHVKIIEKSSQILKDKNIKIIGDKMRKKEI